MKTNLHVERERSGTYRALDSDHDSEVAGILDYVRQSHGVWRFVRSFLGLWIRILRVGICWSEVLSSLVFQIIGAWKSFRSTRRFEDKRQNDRYDVVTVWDLITGRRGH